MTRDPNRPRVIPRQPVAEPEAVDTLKSSPEPQEPVKRPDGKIPFTKPDGTIVYGTARQIGHWNKMKRGLRRRTE